MTAFVEEVLEDLRGSITGMLYYVIPLAQIIDALSIQK